MDRILSGFGHVVEVAFIMIILGSIAFDRTGNVYVTGYYNSPSITFDTATLSNSGIEEVFLAKYDEQGKFLWAKTAAGNSIHLGYAVACDSSGSVYVTGAYYNGQIIFDSIILNSAGYYDYFLFSSYAT
jgi:hypothetical protein